VRSAPFLLDVPPFLGRPTSHRGCRSPICLTYCVTYWVFHATNKFTLSGYSESLMIYHSYTVQLSSLHIYTAWLTSSVVLLSLTVSSVVLLSPAVFGSPLSQLI
jgi:hypothetical protein